MSKPLGEPFVLPGHEMTKAFGDFRFRFYPCGYKPEDHSTIVYVKYKATKHQSYDQPTRVLDAGPDHVHFDLPDRELFFSRNNLAIGESRPFNTPGTKGWDKAVSLTPITSAGDDLPFDRYMLNPHAYTPNTEPRTRDENNIYKSDKLAICDSGGFQMGHGSVSFIHPGELTAFYNRNVDEGIVLDIPARALGDSDILKHTAKVQNLNTRYMKKRLKKGFRLSTVAHGLSLDKVDQYRADIEDFDSDFPIICISGTLRFNLLEGLHRILHIISTGAAYGQYHILGVSNPPLMAALIRLSYLLKKQGRDVLITADSSSPIAFALKHTYYNQNTFYEGLSPTRFGQKMSSNLDAPSWDVSNPHRRWASVDPISQVIGGYQDVISSYNSSITRQYMVYMNQMELVRYINQMNYYASVLEHKEYKALVNEQYKKSAHSHILSVAMDYMHEAFEFGIEKAYERYKFYMPEFSGMKTLHKIPSMQQSEAMLESEVEFGVKKKHLIKVIKNYYEFHKTGKVPTERHVPKDNKGQSALKLRV